MDQSDLIGTTKDERIDMWWEVIKQHDDDGPYKNTKRGATPLVERVIRVYGFDREFTNRVLRGYRQFMELKAIMNDLLGKKLEPPIPIAQMWEQHLLDNLNYTDDCLFLFGKVIGHDPDASLDTVATQERINTTKIAAQARYGDLLDKEIWSYYDIKEGDDENENQFVLDDETASQIEAMRRHPDEPKSPLRGGGGRLPIAGITTVSSFISRNPSKEEIPAASPYRNSGYKSTDVRNPEDDEDKAVLHESHYFGREAEPKERKMESERRNQNIHRQRGQHYHRHSPGQRASHTREPVIDVSRHHLEGRVKYHTTGKGKGNILHPVPPTIPQDPISLILRDKESGEQTMFTLRNSMSSLGIIFSVLAQRKGLKTRGSSIKFFYKGQKLSGYETPSGLEMQEKDYIDFSVSGRK